MPWKVDTSLLPRLPRWPCELCGHPAGRVGICKACHADLPWIGTACRSCARPMALSGTCRACHRNPPAWRHAVAPLAWAFPVDALVTRFKYGGALHLGALLGRLLGGACRGLAADAILPVPLHVTRLAERGFNQARELARPVARLTGLRLLDGACLRCAATPPQAGLSARQRRSNLRQAFRATDAVRGLKLAIVDDVLTTGSTAEALSLELLRAGAAEVQVWAVARGGTAQPFVKV